MNLFIIKQELLYLFILALSISINIFDFIKLNQQILKNNNLINKNF